MAARRARDVTVSPSQPPATTPEGRENQLVSMAVDLAEEQIREGTASSQVITHFLKMGSVREQLERDKIAGENELLRARIAELESRRNVEELYAKALNAMTAYQGNPPLEIGEDFDD